MKCKLLKLFYIFISIINYIPILCSNNGIDINKIKDKNNLKYASKYDYQFELVVVYKINGNTYVLGCKAILISYQDALVMEEEIEA